MLLNKKVAYACVALCAMFTLTACHPKVAPVSKMDNELSCAQLQSEIKDVENLKAKIESKRGFSGRNVGLGLIFPLGIVVNEVTGSTAEQEANARLAGLKNIYVEKHCSAKEHKDLAKNDSKVETKKKG